ncbi:sterile alpha motif domain containing 1a isoform X1 [Scophthalmus maximus]|uniref:sterile alpha motif domain containing 1a isoform X1 n=1 Tax=Scophthalmus maximus TaxID=52904 RepID=UPI001FA922B3|nr:sterile alpha motif domain containing 1a isoform X1 [Scophthalmus maximus]
MSESKYREWILDTIDSLRSRKARPDLERICRMVRRRHGSEPDRTCAELEKLIQEHTVLKVNYKGSISYRNAAKVQRRSRKKDDVTLAAAARRSAVEEASHSDLSNGDSALGPVDQDEEDLEADTSMVMDTDSNADEEGADDSQDGQNGLKGVNGQNGLKGLNGLNGQNGPSGPSPGLTPDSAAARAASAPCSPSGTRPGPGPGPESGPGSALDCVPLQKAGERPSSLPPSSPRALAHNDWAYDSAVCPAERQHPGMQRDKEAAVKPAVPSFTTSPCALENNTKKEDGGKVEEDRRPSSNQLVPDLAAKLDESSNVSDGQPQTLSLPSDNCTFKKKMDISPFTATEDVLLNGGKGDEISVKKEKMSQNLLQWTVTDVASYFSAVGFPEQALAFRSQEIDGKSLLLMQRSDVLTGLSIRLGPALKIYERHVKVLQRTHFLEYEDL